ncbi:unnamed protein product, partial [marine sediment metagenome]
QCRANGIKIPDIKDKINWEKFKWNENSNNDESLMDWI